jgi:hypothetical protein
MWIPLDPFDFDPGDSSLIALPKAEYEKLNSLP